MPPPLPAPQGVADGSLPAQVHVQNEAALLLALSELGERGAAPGITCDLRNVSAGGAGAALHQHPAPPPGLTCSHLWGGTAAQRPGMGWGVQGWLLALLEGDWLGGWSHSTDPLPVPPTAPDAVPWAA